MSLTNMPQQEAAIVHAIKAESVTYSAVIFRDADGEVLLDPDGRCLTVPSFELPPRQRVAPHLLLAVRRRFGVAANCRFGLTLTLEESSRHVVVLEAVGAENESASHRWFDAREIPWGRIDSGIARETLRRALAEASAHNSGLTSGRFAKPGWLAEVQNWTESSVAPLGLCLHGPWTQFGMGPDTSLLCFEACKGDIWFKAVDQAGIREFCVTRQLATFGLPHVAPILAAREDWRAWLMLGSSGRPLDQEATEGQWATAARGLAELQVASIPHCQSMIEAGCLDLRAPALDQTIEPFLSRVSRLFDLQPKDPPRKLRSDDLRLIEQELKACCREIEHMGVPDTLGHSDLNPGNVLIENSRVCFLDWMQGHVGHPVLGFEFLVALHGRLVPENSGLAKELRRTYLGCWRGRCDQDDLERSSDLMPLLAPFAYAMNFHNPAEKLDDRPEVAALLRSLARRMHVEAERLASGPFVFRGRG